MERNIVSVHKKVMRDELKYQQETLVSYRIEYPEFRSSCYQMCLLKVNQFYQDKALEFQKYCETELFRMAVQQYKKAMENDFPIRTLEALLSYEVTYASLCILSIYFDRYVYTGGAHGNTLRESQTWNFQKCRLIRLRQLVRCSPDDRSFVLSAVESAIENHAEIYFENYKGPMEQTFNENSFYCTPKGIVFYYQQYDIAPYSSGIMEFLLPYHDCVIHPRKLCYVF